MNIKRHIKLVIILFVIVVFGYVFQTSVFSFLKLSDIIPNLLIIITCAYGFIHGSNYGMISGFMCGFLMDIYSSFIFGVFLFIFIIIGYVSGLFSKFLYGDGLRLPLLIVAISDFVFGICLFFVRWINIGMNDFNFCLRNIILPEVLYTVALAIVLFPIIQLINKIFDKQKEVRRIESN